jgi:hypothetical protein
MAAVTQRIPNYLGGVSKQSDDKKLPGQVRECYNGYPDPTYGLTKRPGFEHIVNLGTGTTYDDGKWFYINRDDDEEYVGVIKGTDIDIWNATTGATCTVTFPDGTGYLDTTKDNYKVLTVQDTSIIINKSKTVAAQAVPAFNAKRQATIVVNDVTHGSDYTVNITIGGTTSTATVSPSTGDDFDDFIADLKTAIDGLSLTNVTVTTRNRSLTIIKSDGSFEIAVHGGPKNGSLYVFQDQVDNVSRLPSESFHDHVIKVINTDSDQDTYFVKFVAENGTAGEGYWEETVSPNVSPGLDSSTMPHELVNTAVDTFVFRKITYEDRLVGDDKTNEHPSFVNNKITAGFFHNNRLGFLSKDNVSMSQAGEFYNFYHISAQVVTDADPIDLSCSSTRPTALHASIPTPQGVVLFSGDEQFILFSDNGVLTPALSTIRTLSYYEMDTTLDPVDIGTNINFVSKTPGYSRVFSMVTRGQQENPQVLDVGRVVKEWISPNIDNIIASAQNSFLCLYGQTLNELFIYRYYNDGEKNLMQAWVSWLMPGTTQFVAVNSDTMYAVTKQADQFTLSKASLAQSPEQAIIVNNEGDRVNPCIDLYKNIPSANVIYDAANKRTKCYIPYNDVSTLTPVIVLKGDTSGGNFVESGFTLTPERGEDTNGPNSPDTETFFIVPNKNLTDSGDRALDVADDVVVGFKYNFDVELPRTYFRPNPEVSDYTASLTIARMNFAVGLSGMMSFKLQQKGRMPYSINFTGDGSTTVFTFNRRDLDYVERSDVKIKVNGIAETDFTFTNDTTITFTTAPAEDAAIVMYIEEWFDVQPITQANQYLANDVPLNVDNVFTLPIHQRTQNFRVRMFNNSPFPVAINTMMWEGQYTPRFYRRT